jgi:hypothetical protein
MSESGACPADGDWRQSSWEIHPVYGIDVCKGKNLANCRAGNDSVWEPLFRSEPRRRPRLARRNAGFRSRACRD